MSTKKEIPGSAHKGKKPFAVPEGYFDELPGRVMERILSEENLSNKRTGKSTDTAGKSTDTTGKKVHLRPFLSFAAAIAGLALVIYVVLQTIIGTQANNTEYTDLALLEESGILLDEYAIAETIALSENENLSTWEEDAMNYLASNEVDLFHLLESN